MSNFTIYCGMWPFSIWGPCEPYIDKGSTFQNRTDRKFCIIQGPDLVSVIKPGITLNRIKDPGFLCGVIRYMLFYRILVLIRNLTSLININLTLSIPGFTQPPARSYFGQKTWFLIGPLWCQFSVFMAKLLLGLGWKHPRLQNMTIQFLTFDPLITS